MHRLYKAIGTLSRTQSQIWLAGGFIFVLGSTLRLYNLGGKSLWFNAVLSVQMASTNPDQIWKELVRFTNSPSLYLWMLHFFLKIDANEFWARLPLAAFGILTLMLVYYIGHGMFIRHVVFLTSAWFPYLLSVSFQSGSPDVFASD